jgi:Fe2+ or Zn2+ uptake regulation protein
VQVNNLKEVGLKITHPRKRIFEVLEEKAHKHMTADDIYRSLVEAGEDIGLATVYRVLSIILKVARPITNWIPANTMTTWSAWRQEK